MNMNKAILCSSKSITHRRKVYYARVMADYDKDLVQYSFYEKEEEVASQFKEAQIISCNSLAAVKETLPKKVREFKTPKELTSEEV